jgi:serine/threonine protein kinase
VRSDACQPFHARLLLFTLYVAAILTPLLLLHPVIDHLQGIIHRDVKPDNIGVHRSSQHLHLFDWGEAVTLDDVTSLPDKQLASSVGVAGTPLFMAPEALAYLTSPPGEARAHLRDTLTTKLDIWGMGTVLYFLLAGRDVFEDSCNFDLENIVDLATASTGIELPEGTHASCAARDFLRRCLEADLEQRASTKELMEHPWLRGAASFEELMAAQATAAALPSAAAAGACGSKQCSSGGKEGSHGVKQVLAVVADAGTSTDCSVDGTSRTSSSSSSSSSYGDHMASSSSSARHPLVEVDLVQRRQQQPGKDQQQQQQQQDKQQQDQGHKAQQQQEQQQPPAPDAKSQQRQQQDKNTPPASTSAAAAAAAAGHVSIRASNPAVAAAFAAATRGQPSHAACWQPRPLPAALAPAVGHGLPASAAAAHRSSFRHQVPLSHPLVGSATQARQRVQQAPAAAALQQQQQQQGTGMPLTAAALAQLNSRDGKPFDEAVCEVRLRPSPSAASLTQLNSIS